MGSRGVRGFVGRAGARGCARVRARARGCPRVRAGTCGFARVHAGTCPNAQFDAFSAQMDRGSPSHTRLSEFYIKMGFIITRGFGRVIIKLWQASIFFTITELGLYLQLIVFYKKKE